MRSRYLSSSLSVIDFNENFWTKKSSQKTDFNNVNERILKRHKKREKIGKG